MTRTGFFAGSFDPPTLGHLDLVLRARAVVDRLVVGVGVNADKAPWLPLEERLALLSELLPSGVTVVGFIRDRLVAEGTVGPDDPDRVLLTDSPDEALRHILRAAEAFGLRQRRRPKQSRILLERRA